MTARKVAKFLRYYSTWVVVFFAGCATAYQTMPTPLHDRMIESLPWLAGWEPFVWFVAFMATFYKLRTTPQGIDEPK